MDVSKNLGSYIKSRGYKITEIARKTGLNYHSIYNGLCGKGNRQLRANELVVICIFLDIDPRKFADSEL